MIHPGAVILFFCLYMGSLLLIALWVERKSQAGRQLTNHPVIYALSFSVYLTSWTYYGGVGTAARSGMLFLSLYIGSTLSCFLWWLVLRKMIRIKSTQRITSIADFISARYGKSQALGALATVVAIMGVTPYIALQLKSIISTFSIITMPPPENVSGIHPSGSWFGGNIDLAVVAMMIAFTIILGVRRLDPTERHQGMVMVLVLEGIVKLGALIAVGVFVTFFMFDGPADVFGRIARSPHRDLLSFFNGKDPAPLEWRTYVFLSVFAVLFLPRQFHVAVVENFEERHVLTAMWLFPFYMLLMNLFIFPIALGGLLQGLSISQADNFVLLLPLRHGEPWLTALVFIGGFSAAAGMIMLSSVTLAIMATNHLLIPVTEWISRLAFLKRQLLKCRWVIVAGFILIAYGFEVLVGEAYVLVNIGLISFAAVLQFAPVILGGIFWRHGSKGGAVAGLVAGILVWAYTLLLPSFVKSGWIARSVLDRGPAGLGLLKPEELLGLTGLDPVSHAVFWSLLFNVGFYVAGSLYFEQTEEEQGIAQEFVAATSLTGFLRPLREREATVDLEVKKREMANLLSQYFPASESRDIIHRCLQASGIERKERISIVELIDFHTEVERHLAGAIGSAAAHKAITRGTVFTPKEAKELSEVYEEMLEELQISSAEFKKRINHYRERIALAEQRYFDLVRHSPSPIYVLRSDFQLEFINQACSMMFGTSPEEALSTPDWFFNSIHPRDRERIRKLFEGAFRSGGSPFSAECRFIHKDGHHINAIIKSIPSFGWEAGAEVDRLQGIVVDITDRVFLEKALAQKETLNALRAISSEVAHEIRNPLMSIGGFAHRLQKKYPDAAEPEIILKESKRLEKLMDRIRDYLKPVEISPEECSINDVIRECLHALEDDMNRKNVSARLSLARDLSRVYADREILDQIFKTLIHNALDEMKENDFLTINTYESEENIHIEFRHRLREQKRNESEILFLPFDETAQNLGLPLCYRLLKYMDGLLSFVQEQDEILFTVSLPRRREREFVSSPSNEPPKS